MSTLARVVPASLCALLGLGAHCADAKVEILQSPVTLLNVVTSTGTEFMEFPAAARALGPGVIVGVYPAAPGNTLSNAFGFAAVNPTDAPLRVPARTLPRGTLAELEPYDVNASGVFVGRARQPGVPTRPSYAFGNSAPNAPLVRGLEDPTQFAGSAATAVNNRNVVVGWAQPSGGNEQAFYWTGGAALNRITIDGATSSRAESVSNTGQVAGYFEKAGERYGFVFDIASGVVNDDVGQVVVPTATSWFYDFRNVSINDDGVVAATRAIASGTETVNQAFLMDGNGNFTPILPTTGFRDSFAAGISDTGWVVGMLRNADGSIGSGFLWYGGRTFDLSTLTLGANWQGITAVYDVYSEETSDPLVQIGTIVGMGTYLESGASVPQQRAFAMQITLQVPEPHTYLILGLGLLAIGALRMRRLPPA